MTTRAKIESAAREFGWRKLKRFAAGDRFSVYHDPIADRYVYIVWTRSDRVLTASIRNGAERVEKRIKSTEPRKAESVIGWLSGYPAERITVGTDAIRFA